MKITDIRWTRAGSVEMVNDLGQTLVIPSGGVVTPTQAAKLLDKSVVWVYRLIHMGSIRAEKKQGTTLIPLGDIRKRR